MTSPKRPRLARLMCSLCGHAARLHVGSARPWRIPLYLTYAATCAACRALEVR